MLNFTYLIGAGASAKALPLIKRLPDGKLEGLSAELLKFIEIYTSNFLSENFDWSNQSIESLKEIARKCIEFGTPDLYAKFLLETGDLKTYGNLKQLLSVYFNHKQYLGQSFDHRALTFLTAISNRQNIPSNVKILSWNYDSQLEIAAQKLRPLTYKANAIQGFSTWPNITESYHDKDVPFLIHLNGVAGYELMDDCLCKKINHHYRFSNERDFRLMLSFAWESQDDFSNEFLTKRAELIEKIARNTNILIVIGYSFPFFNRNIDRNIFSKMESLKKIYIQDPYNYSESLSNRFNLVGTESRGVKIEHIESTDNYHIPFEF